jgi:hypothetical protein
VTPKKFPAICPRCGAGIGRFPETDVRKHFERAHAGMIGTAFKDGDEWFEFAFVMPEAGATRRWHIIAFGFPFEVVTIRPDEYEIQWRERAPA